MTTYTLKAKEITETWHVVDASGRALGRMASEIAATLRGKNRPTFTPSMGNGDFVIVINAAQVKISGDMNEKKYYRHSGYPGGLKTVTQEKLLATRPERVIEFAVKGMLPHNSHGAKLLRHLKVYAGSDHPHQAQVNAGKATPRDATAPTAPKTKPQPEPEKPPTPEATTNADEAPKATAATAEVEAQAPEAVTTPADEAAEAPDTTPPTEEAVEEK